MCVVIHIVVNCAKLAAIMCLPIPVNEHPRSIGKTNLQLEYEMNVAQLVVESVIQLPAAAIAKILSAFVFARTRKTA